MSLVDPAADPFDPAALGLRPGIGHFDQAALGLRLGILCLSIDVRHYPHTIAAGAIRKQYAVFKSLPSSRVLQGRWYDDIDAALQAIEQVHGKLVWAPDVTDEWIKQQKTAPHY